MLLDEQAAKELFSRRGIRIPRGRAVTTPQEAVRAQGEIGGAVVLKPLLLMGKRGKAGLIRCAEGAEEAGREAASLLREPGVDRLRVEERVPIEREIYVAVANDASEKSPVVLYSDEGGVEVESAKNIVKWNVDIAVGLDAEGARRVAGEELAPLLLTLYRLYRELDAELVEINPLARTPEKELVALDAKLEVDDAALGRHPELERPPESGTELEREARASGLYYIELEGDVGILANGAGLTMATLDVVRFHGGRPANFMEIGGDAYRKAEQALGIVLGNPRVKSLLVNLCGAYARTDVMIQGFLAAWKTLSPSIPVAFSIRGTGQQAANALVRDELGIEPFDTMDAAVRAAIEAARRT